MRYDPDKHHRRSIRLRGYDYSQPGAYFVTICVQRRQCLFGEIVGEEMRLNDAGHMVERWWAELANKFPMVDTQGHGAMPNHFHGVVVIRADVGAALRGRPLPSPGIGHPHRDAPTVGDILDWFKTMTTNEYIRGVKTHAWTVFPGKLWQRGYYEHVVRDDDELQRIQEYIATNPQRWAWDAQNPAATPSPASGTAWET